MDTTTVTTAEPAAGPPQGGESAKGLSSGTLGLFASVVIGVASVAPGYSLAATLGLLPAIKGMRLEGPFIFLAGFVPMILVASGFFYMNRADPDCGETFIWTSRAFGAPLGWIIGFAAVASSVIVMANLVQIAAQYMFLIVGWNSAANSTLWNTVGGVAWILIVALFVAIGINVSARAQYVLMAMQMIPLVLFTVWALIKGYATHPSGFAPIRLSLVLHHPHHGQRSPRGVVLAVFLYWGWDTVLAVNEESEDSHTMPGVSAVLNTLILVVMYVLITAAMQSYQGPGFLAENPDDVFSPIAQAVMGGPGTGSCFCASSPRARPRPSPPCCRSPARRCRWPPISLCRRSSAASTPSTSRPSGAPSS